MDSLLSLIEKYTDNRQILVNELVDDGPIRICCPYCETKDILYLGYSCTCVGGTPDPNHYCCNAKCKKCEKQIYYEHHLNVKDHKTTNVWFTDKNGVVLSGIHNCCYNAKYIHNHCGGLLYTKHTELDGITVTHSLRFQYYLKNKFFRSFISCNKCELNEEFE